MPDPTPQSRSVRGWVVVRSDGRPWLSTVRHTSDLAKLAFEYGAATSFDVCGVTHGVTCVPCTITTDPPAPKEGA